MTYCLPPDYQARLTPQYFSDTLTDSQLWQADVYRAAVHLARKAGVKRIVDLGCGRGGKLMPLAREFKIVGIDYGDNIDYCRNIAPAGEWYDFDLNEEIVPAKLFQDAIVICADVIEHLPTPDALIETLHNASQTAAYVLVSTPDRERLYGDANHWPPDNPAHCQEWTLAELEDWFTEAILPIRWSGWTISYDKQPDRVNTCLIVLAQENKTPDMPITFQPSPLYRMPVTPYVNRLLKVYMTPTPNEAGRDVTNAINQIVCRVDKHLPDYGVQLVEHPDNADLSAGHAGQGTQAPIDVCHYHGLYNTAQGSDNYAVNAAVIHNLKTAYRVTAPSNWIADILRRDMHLNPRVIGWGVDTEEWQPAKEHQGYVIWNKARVDNVSNPQPMLELAARAHDTLFLTTFGQGTPNVRTVGRQVYPVMKEMVRHAAVYLSTNVETFGIGLMEALAAGVPILSFKQGAQVDYIQHGVNGFLAEVGDMDGLYEGLKYCLKYRDRLGANARETAKRYTWQRVAQQFAEVYQEVMAIKQDVRPHRIDESLYKIG